MGRKWSEQRRHGKKKKEKERDEGEKVKRDEKIRK